jgi:hypothetical protein
MIRLACEKSRAMRWRFSLASLLIVVTVLAVLFAVMRPVVVAMLIASLIAVVFFYAILISIAIFLREPFACAITWIAVRLVAFVPFLVAAALVGGENAWVVAMWGFFPDVPMSPLFFITNQLTHYVHESFGAHGWGTGGESIGSISNLALYLIWYGGGGYLVGLWAQRRFGDRVTGKTPK